jgi:hypothetical protein
MKRNSATRVIATAATTLAEAESLRRMTAGFQVSQALT